MAKQNVWIVISGEKGEGGSVDGVYSSYGNAKDAALSTPRVFDGEWKPMGEDKWQNGCDWVGIELHEVKKK